MYWVNGLFGMAFIASPFVLGYFASDVVGLWCSVIAGFAVVLLSVKARGLESPEAGHEVGCRRRGSLCPVEIRQNDYRQIGRR